MKITAKKVLDKIIIGMPDDDRMKGFIIMAMEEYHEMKLKELSQHDIIKNEVAVCSLKGISFCQYEKQNGECNFDENCINKKNIANTKKS